MILTIFLCGSSVVIALVTGTVGIAGVRGGGGNLLAGVAKGLLPEGSDILPLTALVPSVKCPRGPVINLLALKNGV